ncbi:toll/interleukin-1 receptor domain-containing protein [Dyadobacter sp. LHD-138]|uniref:toll/interleukin-1 receptor domain-containing protein n=1 Tax=Dyadobacter sp. LHD-138 TaxID=3071413 RepID=UPI0027E099D3|nr:toll/interleukin-1 receptor domain-containing protein [Dyadobacter sp. LHD-138]MDQ6478860.1 toll/interleukin-1 receptor domain-containing protein [Dyadobacter sp. LHD-138]
MLSKEQIIKRVFISYSWTTLSHEEWVINLAERLVSDGVDTTIDKWDLKEGQDKYDFMESMVKSPEIDKVLIILDRKYSEKADQRSGGVGTETQIISPQVYNNVSQEKFIPIVAERNEEGKGYFPTYLESRIYVDLSDQDTFEENYEKLIRNIFGKPAYSKPQLGKMPSYLQEEIHLSHKTSILVRGFDAHASKNSNRINSLLRDFLDEFTESLKGLSFKIQKADNILMGKQVHDQIILSTPLRNDFIAFFDKVTKEEYGEFDVDIILKFLERLPLFKRPLDETNSFYEIEFDHFKFLIHEIFLYLIATGIKNENYKFIEELFYSGYYFQDKYTHKKEPSSFSDLYNYVDSFDAYYKETYSKNFHSSMADLIIKRIPDSVNKEHLIEADLLCFYIATMNDTHWFAMTYIYYDEYKPIPFFNRITSKRHFEKVKGIFDVQNEEELKRKLTVLKEKGQERRISYSGSFRSIEPIYSLINIENIGSTR